MIFSNIYDMLRHMKELLRQLPSVDEMLKEPAVRQWLKSHPRVLVLEAVRTAIQLKRQEIMDAADDKDIAVSVADIISRARDILNDIGSLNLRPIINATGVVVHTNLGRSILSEAAIQKVIEVSRSYSNLEYDIALGERGKRYVHIEGIIRRLTGAEAATVVNNNAAAVLLCLNTLAAGKEVIVSRGELVEIGGSFRIPEVMERSGARLREVGATNKTHLKDYEKAINENTGLLLKVHTSNYKIVGFVKEVTPSELVALGKRHNIPVMWDLGSGSFIDLSSYGIGDEPTVQQATASGVDIVTFSGDKLLGGPQAGVIVGKKVYLDPIRSNPLSRALRVDKMTLAGLEATLYQYLDMEKAVKEIPTLWMLTQPLSEIERKAKLLHKGMENIPGISVSILDEQSQSGGGALPTGFLPTKVVAISHERLGAEQIEFGLRTGRPHIIARIKEGLVLFDPRTLNDDEIGKIVDAIRRLVG